MIVHLRSENEYKMYHQTYTCIISNEAFATIQVYCPNEFSPKLIFSLGRCHSSDQKKSICLPFLVSMLLK
jgi:hypothetical protein